MKKKKYTSYTDEYYLENMEEAWDYDYYLAQRAVKGDESAWMELYRSSYEKVFMFVMKQCNWYRYLTSSDAESIVNEAFSRCYCKLEFYEGRSRFYSWVRGFAKFVVLEENKRNFKYVTKAHSVAFIMPTNISPEDNLIRNELYMCVWLAFDSLGKKQRDIVDYTVLEELKVSAVANLMNLHKKEVKAELEDAKVRMKRSFNAVYTPELI